MEFRLDTKIMEDDSIIQKLFKIENNLEEKLSTWIINTREKQFIDSLIELGWTPPNKNNNKNK